MSPGMTTVLPHAIGTLISPGPSLSHAPGLTVRLNAGKPSRVMPSMSRIAPSTTMPPSFFAAAVWHMSSPKTAVVRLPHVSTTTTSPGSATCSALWTMRLSAGRQSTVTARPQSGKLAARLDARIHEVEPAHGVGEVRRWRGRESARRDRRRGAAGQGGRGNRVYRAWSQQSCGRREA